VVLAAAAAAEARDFVVGGANDGWKAQVQPDALTKWASVLRFQVGDNLGKRSSPPTLLDRKDLLLW
jgi:hypothetical protein